MIEQGPYQSLRSIDEVGVKETGEQFDADNAMVEAALKYLFGQVPSNAEESKVLLKVTVVNSLYYTGILAIQTVAQHICGHHEEIDRKLISGDLNVVDLIAKVKVGNKVRNNYSFATKYCSWHRPDVYPIWDSRVDKYLWRLCKQGKIPAFPRNDLYDYPKFRGIIDSFRETFGLQSLDYKKIDKFLFVEGDKLFKPRSEAPTAPVAAE